MEIDLNLSLCRHDAGPGRDLQRDIAMKISNGSQDLAALSLKTVSARTAGDFAAAKNSASVALNPQPLPPRDAGEAKKAAAFGNSDAVALNPQPLPPKDAGAAKKAAAFGNSDAVALNPQPLPPRDAGAAKKAAAFGNFDAGALNPQPLPPKDAGAAKKAAAFANSDAGALNPQPLPPKDAGAAKKAAAFGNSDAGALNPQPLPPKDAGAAKKAAAFGNSDAVALNPQPLPPKDAGAARRDPVTKAIGDSASAMEQYARDSIDRRSKMASTFSNLPRKLSDTADRNAANAAVFGSVALKPQPLPPKEVSGGAAGRDDVTKAKIDSTIDKAKSDLDSMSEMGEMESLRLQMAMDRRSKLMSTLSNALEKVSDTADGITANLK
jgi:hypothetical protein